MEQAPNKTVVGTRLGKEAEISVAQIQPAPESDWQ